MTDYTTKWQLLRDIDRAVTEIVETHDFKDTVYSDHTFELRVDVAGRKPELVEVHFLEMPWFYMTSRYQAMLVFGGIPARGLGFHNYTRYSWTLRKVR